LQQMMGPEAMGVQPINVDWWDPKVCKNFICGTCPHDIFGNTVSTVPSHFLACPYVGLVLTRFGNLLSI
jgi:hypothetical protein